MTTTDQLYELSLQEMEQRILLGFALNRGREASSLYWMAPAESMAASGVRWDRGENRTWADAIRRLVERNILEARRCGTDYCTIPVFGVADPGSLPFGMAARIKERMSRSRLRRKILVPDYAR